MVKSGRKVALAFLGSYALAQMLRERGIIEDDPLVVYTYSAMIRDLLALIPDWWEEALGDRCGRLPLHGSPPRPPGGWWHPQGWQGGGQEAGARLVCALGVP